MKQDQIILLADLLRQIEKCNWEYFLPEKWESPEEHACYFDLVERALIDVINENQEK